MIMPVELKIPAVGESITEVQIGDWLKREGDTVRADEPVAVIDSEKTTFELPAPQSGKLAKILHNAGDTVRVGTVIGHIEPSGETEKAGQAENESARPATEPSAAAASKAAPPIHKETDGAESATEFCPEPFMQVAPGAHIHRFFLDPEHGHVLRIGMQCLLELPVAQGVELFESNNADFIAVVLVPMSCQFIIQLACA